MQITGSPNRFSSVQSQVQVAPLSSPTRTASGACKTMKAAIASGSVMTVPSRTIFPLALTMQIAVDFSETSSPT